MIEHAGQQFGGTQSPGRIGNPPHEVTEKNREMVRLYAKVMSQDMIASAFDPPISVDTLQRHYRNELDAGKREAIAKIGGKLLEKALNGNLTAMIFYLRTQGRWATRHEVSGPNGGPLKLIDLTAFLAGKSEEECQIIERLLEHIITAGGVAGPEAGDSGAGPGEGLPGEP